MFQAALDPLAVNSMYLVHVSAEHAFTQVNVHTALFSTHHLLGVLCGLLRDSVAVSMGTFQRPGRLEKVHSILGLGKADREVDVVYVPEYGSRPSRISSLQSLLAQAHVRAQLFKFEYGFEKREIWPTLIQRGDELLASLIAEQGVTRVLTTLALQFYDPACQRLLNRHSGTVFLGTPHLTFGNRSHWLKLSLILRASAKFSKALLAQAEIEAAYIANISLKFEQAGFEDTILSVFETKETKISEGLFKSRKEYLVDQLTAGTGARHEILIPSAADHYEVSKIVEGSRIYQEVISLVEFAARRQLDSSISLSSLRDAVTNAPGEEIWASTVADAQETPRKESTSTGASPANATLDSTETQKSEVMAALTDFTSSLRSPRFPCYLLKSHTENPDFFGRNDILRQLDQALTVSSSHSEYSVNSSLHSFVLCGFGGIGKTQIAIQYAFSRKAQYDAGFWVQADEVGKMANSFKEIAIELKLLEASEATDPVVTKNIVMEWLSTPYKTSTLESNDDTPLSDRAFAKWLMIFDNADKPEILHDFWPVSGNGSALVTSRDPQTKMYLHANGGIDLQPFGRDEAALFLHNLLPNEPSTQGDQESSLTLADRLGGFPLALVHVSAVIRRRRLTFSEVLEMYDGESLKSNLYNSQVMSPHDKYTHSLSTVWAFENLNKPAVHLLDLLALLDPDCISESILQSSVSQYSAEGFKEMQDSYVEARTDLLGSSLVKRNKDEKQLTLHRVVQEGVRNRMSSQRMSIVFGFTVELLLLAWDHDPEEKFTHLKALWDVAKLISPHAAQLKTVYERRQPHLTPQTKISFARLLQKSGWYLFETSYDNSAMPALKLALKIYKQQPQQAYNSDSQVLLADILFCLATLSAEQNFPKDALLYAERHFEVRMEVERKKDALGRHAGLAYTELGLAYMLNDRFEEAINSCRVGKDILVQIPSFKEGKYWPDFAVIHESMALIGLDRGQEAVPMLEASIKYREKRYGPNDTESFKLGFHLQLLGTVYFRRGAWHEAFSLFQRALSNYRATVGDHYYRTSHVCVKLAECHAREGQVEAANIFFDQALRNFELHASTKPEFARTTYKKARFMEEIGNKDAAKELMDKAEKLYADLVPSHRATREQGFPREEDFDRIVPLWSR